MSQRIVHLCRVGYPRLGGMEAAVHGLARTQVAAGHDVRVLTLRRLHRGEPALPPVTQDGVHYERLGSVGPGRYPVPLGLRRAVGQASWVHVHGIDGLADVAVRVLDAPVIVSTHGAYFHTERNWRVKQLVLRTLTRSTLNRARAVFYTSEADRERMAAAGVPGEVLGNGVDIDRFRSERRPERGRWVMLGRVQEHKGLADLARWLPELDVVLHVVGEVVDGEHVAQVTRRLARAGHGHKLLVHGALADAGVAEQLARAELLIAPSRSEGFGIAVVEAMGAGVPALVASGTALEERVAQGGGWTIDVRAADAGSRLKEWVGADHTAVGQRAREVAMQYGWDTVGAQWEQAIQSILAS